MSCEKSKDVGRMHYGRSQKRSMHNLGISLIIFCKRMSDSYVGLFLDSGFALVAVLK